MEQGPLVCGPKGNEWWSAQWRLVPDVDVKYSIINRWIDCKLTRFDNALGCEKSDKRTAENLWVPINLTPETVFVRRRPKPATLPPAPASEQSPPQIDKGGGATFLTTDGSFPSYLSLGSPESRSRLGGNFDEDIEAIDVYGQFTEVIGYENPNFTGRTVTLRCGHYELIGDPENEISSIRVQVAVRPTANCMGGTASSGVLIVSDGESRVEVHNWDR
jgi:hypothetical protein